MEQNCLLSSLLLPKDNDDDRHLPAKTNHLWGRNRDLQTNFVDKKKQHYSFDIFIKMILKDHFNLPSENSSAKSTHELTENFKLLKSDKLKQFAVVEEKRSKLYKSLIAKVNSNCIDEKLFSALPCEVYPPPPPSSSVNKTPLSPYRINGHQNVSIGSNTIMTNSRYHRSKLSARSSGTTEGTITEITSTDGNTTTTTTTTTTNNNNTNERKDELTTMNLMNLSNRAKALSLYSFPHIIKSVELKAYNLYERKARQMRQVVGRRMYSDAERKNACLQRQIKEDIILSEKVKAEAEKHFHKLKSIKSRQLPDHSRSNCVSNLSENTTSISSKSSINSTVGNNTVTDKSDQLSAYSTTTLEDKLYPTPCGSFMCNENTNSNNSIDCSNKHRKQQLESTDDYDEVLSMWHSLLTQLNKKELPNLCLCMRYSSNNDGVYTGRIPPWLECASNCRFYQKPEAFLKSLTDYIQSQN
uniref:Uncharacterized protein n=1 Tax=Trichobilharzia regenti TaxID=157069 RepID=A0AA85K9U4_TRIRE|nr:unnamed protein product [Trichobilharzia regenti]